MTLPLLAPSIIAAASIVFLFTFTSFGVVLLLSDPAHATLEVEIYRQAIELFDLPTAAALALVQIVAVLAVLLALARAQERRAVTQRLVARARHRAPAARAASSSSSAASSARPPLFLGGPLVVLVLRSLHIGGQLEARVVPGARVERVDRHAVRLAVGGGAQLDRVRRDRHGDRARRRRAGVGRRSRRARAGRRARWTRS